MNSGESRADAILHELLAAPRRKPDEAFVLRIERLALAERRLRSARRAAFRRFGVELAALASVAAAFLSIGRPAASDSGGAVLSSAPAVAALMLLFVWLCVAARTEILPRGR
jgi:hypothetical protein